MTVKILLAVGFGILFGLFIFPVNMATYMSTFISIGLCILLFFVGIDIGRQENIAKKVKELGLKVLLVPLMVALGSIIGSMFGGAILGIPINQAGAIGAGFGWYSLSAIELAKHSAQLGTLAFITNVCREIIAIIIIPIIAKYIGKLESIAPAGATAMDTTLPIISKATDGNVAVISFITGASLSLLVPILVPFFMILQ
ncbi:lysine exporter LysO family protein [Alkaliphilus sp. MSJ-5]|uniref:Lysine exporter LysO family protein n=1 Tax=Alkaliphilus flagellatus TaxID=2841507 RepID=A0ABS6G671_9FIRM|nr:lysine exporter LysO family protein [Alkaliphilus flagellatus]